MLIVLLIAGCDRKGSGAKSKAAPARSGERSASFADERRGFQTKLLRQEKDGEAAPQPPAELFQLVRYDSPAGKLAAYLTPALPDGGKRPAIVWLVGGFSNGIGDDPWAPASPDNDQSARAFREAGVVMMYPSLRGGNDNPGVKEGFFGEVDDVLAAADFLARQPHVDPARIYLGGHSTGGTLALLAAAAAPPGRFRAVFSFGPVADAGAYGQDRLPFDLNDQRERAMRQPARWIESVRTPVFVLEGTGKPGNISSLRALSRAARGNPAVHFHPVPNATHFSILSPATKLIASKVLRDEGPETNIRLTEQEMDGLMRE